MKRTNTVYWIILTGLLYGLPELLSYKGLIFLNRFKHTGYEPADVLKNEHKGILTA
ncbi:hypothetical protein JW948_08250 [bacterium]|nr:hypothetical protein [bacterium]